MHPSSLRPAPSAHLLLIGCALLSALLCAAPALAAFVTGDNVRTLQHDGLTREYNVHVPPGYDGSEAFPLVVDIHGATSDRTQQQGISGWDDLAVSTQSFLVAYPLGTPDSLGGYTWNAGVCCGDAAASGIDDVGFIRAMVAAIQAEGNIDADRVYATGLSNGGAMTHKLACEASDVFAAAAPMAFPTPYADFATECAPAESIPVLTFMGLSDVLVLYENGIFGGAVESFESWRTKNGCDGPEPIEIQTPLGGSDCQIDTSCSSATEVGLCSITGSALAPPLDAFSGHILYLNDDGLDLATMAWSFFNTGTIEPPVAVPGLDGARALGLVTGLALLGLGLARRRKRP